MSLAHRVRTLEDKTGMGDVVVPVSFIFGGESTDCKHYRDKSCQRTWNNKPLDAPEGAKIKFAVMPFDSKEADPCSGCTDCEKALRT